jgi:glucuronate isomerase
VFSLNPNDNAAIVSGLGCFSGAGVVGKLQHGSAWWFNDNKTGMIGQMTNLANMSVLGNFLGMLTDSRSFLSYTRHEYFRRILCNLLGQWVESGEYPADMKSLGRMVEDISYNNAVKYFGF